jgi:SAM-dependent methyltransferase
MSIAHESNEEQAALWNGVAGITWMESQDLVDRLYEPFERLLVETVRAAGARSVLDVGCGTGATTLAIARAGAADGRFVGVDISRPMIEVARARAARERSPARFVCADAQAYQFEPAAFDAIVSRFGVMFFADPVRAFANLRRAARAGGSLRVIAWRSPAENEFMTAAERAAAPLLPNLPPRPADGPGPFAFADAPRVREILERAGWAEIDIRPLDIVCAFPAKELVDYFTRLGPVGRFLHDADPGTRERVIAAVRPAFEPYVQGDEVRFVAACWMVGARAPAG